MYTLKFVVYTSKIYSMTASDRELCFLCVGQLLIFLRYIVCCSKVKSSFH